MNRTVRLILIACVAVMLAAGAAAVWQGWQDPAPLGRGLLRPYFLLGSAIVFAGLIVFMERQLASTRLRVSDDHRRYAQSAALTWYIVLAIWWAWIALRTYGLVPASPIGRDTLLRAFIVFTGVALAVRGNFFGKIAPPTGERAPDPGVWTRTALRTGWIMAGLGLVLVVSAIALPLRTMVLVFVPVTAVMVALALAHRRLLRV
jgi:hypothetical protein